jgi:hypothetical protein
MSLVKPTDMLSATLGPVKWRKDDVNRKNIGFAVFPVKGLIILNYK